MNIPGSRRAKIFRILATSGLLAILMQLGCTSLILDEHTDVYNDGPITLEANEGILVVDVTSDLWIYRLNFGSYRIENIEHSEFRLIVVKAGEYSWRNAIGRSRIYPLGWVDRNKFDVKAGVINYPGKLVIQDVNQYRFTARVINRSAAALMHLRSRFPTLLKKLPLRYSGSIRDDFYPEYFNAENRLR